MSNEKKCLQFDHGTWTEHSTLNQERVHHSSVTTQTGTFLFGGKNSWETFEYLPKDSTKWLKGKTKIPEGFAIGCAITVKSEQEIWLIGGKQTERRILSFNVKDHLFQEQPFRLNVGRYRHRCAFIPTTNKVMITGGYNHEKGHLNSTEILDTEDGSVTMASSMNFKRTDHGIGIVTINGEERLAVFGRTTNLELYNTQTEKWDITNVNLKEVRSGFGFLSVKLGDVISHLGLLGHICKDWKPIVDSCNIVEEGLGMISKLNNLKEMPNVH